MDQLGDYADQLCGYHVGIMWVPCGSRIVKVMRISFCTTRTSLCAPDHGDQLLHCGDHEGQLMGHKHQAQVSLQLLSQTLQKS